MARTTYEVSAEHVFSAVRLEELTLTLRVS